MVHKMSADKVKAIKNTRAAYTFVDLFCGAGGLSQGFIEAGFKELLSLDNNLNAIETHKANFSSTAMVSTISDDTYLPSASVILGGPPCQGFSSAGLRRNGDQRNSLVACFAKLIAQTRPEAFVFENVEGFLTTDGGERVLDLLVPLLKAGYQVHLRKINAANYGVPQHRKRVVAIGGLGWAPRFPEPTHSAQGAPGSTHVAPHLPPCPTIVEALEGLIEPAQTPPGNPQGHYMRLSNGLENERLASLKPGQTMRDLSIELHHVSYARRANRRVRDGVPSEQRGGAPAGLRRLRPDEPSKAITGGACTELVHPSQDRTLTIRECARVQTFPDEFVFRGNYTQQIQLVGNAVPPLLARAIAKTLKEDLDSVPTSRSKGRLLSFVPTHATGMSPALKKTTEKVYAECESTFRMETLPLWQ